MTTPIRKNVLGMEPYKTGKPIDEVKRELGLDRVIKLASNENPLGPSPLAVEALKQAADRLHLYPDGSAFDLKQALSKKFDIAPEAILLGNGSDELIHLLGLLYLGDPEDELMMGDPGFSRYDAAAHLAPAKLVKVPLNSDLRHDLPEMAKRATAKTKLIFIANPNNPTGTIVYKSELQTFLKDLPAETTVVLDEAYAEFCDDVPDFPHGIDNVKSGQRIIVLRTLSKAYGLAGIRIGYGFADPAIVDAYQRAREPFNTNSLAQVAAIAALDDYEHVRRTVDHNRKSIERISRAVESIGAKAFPSFANFVLADLGRPAEPLFQALLHEGVIVRGGAGLGLPTFIRVTVGTDEEIDMFETALAKVATREVAL